MGFFNRNRQRQQYYYVVTWARNGKMVVIALKGCKNEIEANKAAYEKLKGRTFEIMPSDSSQISEATRQAKGLYFNRSGDLEGSIERASHREPSDSEETIE